MHKIIKALALTLIFTALSASFCFADINGDNGKSIPSVVTSIPVKHEIRGDKYTGNDQFTFVLTAEDDKAPMPEGANGRTKTVTVTGAASPDFGEMIFDYPDAYYYTITRSPRPHINLTEGTESYRVMIAKFNDGTSVMVTWNKDGHKADEISFIDTYKAPVPVEKEKPKTGEDIGLGYYIGLGAVFVAALIGLIVIRKRDKKEGMK